MQLLSRPIQLRYLYRDCLEMLVFAWIHTEILAVIFSTGKRQSRPELPTSSVNTTVSERRPFVDHLTRACGTLSGRFKTLNARRVIVVTLSAPFILQYGKKCTNYDPNAMFFTGLQDLVMRFCTERYVMVRSVQPICESEGRDSDMKDNGKRLSRPTLWNKSKVATIDGCEMLMANGLLSGCNSFGKLAQDGTNHLSSIMQGGPLTAIQQSKKDGSMTLRSGCMLSTCKPWGKSIWGKTNPSSWGDPCLSTDIQKPVVPVANDWCKQGILHGLLDGNSTSKSALDLLISESQSKHLLFTDEMKKSGEVNQEGQYSPWNSNIRGKNSELQPKVDLKTLTPEIAAEVEGNRPMSPDSGFGDSDIDSLIFPKLIAKACGVCNTVVEKSKFFNQRRYGLLSNCHHVFCYPCIDKLCKQTSVPFVKTAVCPTCSVESDSVASSEIWMEGAQKAIFFLEFRSEVSCDRNLSASSENGKEAKSSFEFTRFVV